MIRLTRINSSSLGAYSIETKKTDRANRAAHEQCTSRTNTTSSPNPASRTSLFKAKYSGTHTTASTSLPRPGSFDCPAPPHGRILNAAHLDEATEKRLVAENGGKGLLLPYGRFNPKARPVIITHGLTGAAEELNLIIEEYAKDATCQVYVFLYDDVNRYVDRHGDDLAREVEMLRSDYLTDKRAGVQFIGHSMGAVVSRCAVNSMHNPNWFPSDQGIRGAAQDEKQRLARPCLSNFARVDIITLDGPFGGYAGPKLLNIRNAFKKESSFKDMVAGSDLMQYINTVEMPSHVNFNHIVAASEPGAGTGIQQRMHYKASRFTAREVNQLARFIMGKKKRLNHRLQNKYLTLRAEKDFPAIEAELRSLAQKDELSYAAFNGVLQKYVSYVAGNHSEIVHNPDLLTELHKLDPQ